MSDLSLQADSLFIHAFNHAPIGMALVGLDGKWLKVNASLCKIVGYSEDELLTKTFQEITYHEDIELDMDYASQLLIGIRDSYQMEKRYIHQSGHLVWVLLSGSIVRNEQGDPTFFIAQIEDIAERKRAEQRLQESQQQYKSLFEHHPDFVFSLTLGGRLFHANDSCEKVTGYIAEELESFTQLVVPDHLSLLHYHVDQTLKGTPQHYELAIVHKQGHTVLLRITNVPIVIEGEIAGIHGIAKDVTEFKLESKKRYEFETLYRLISENTQDLISVVTPDGITQYVSPVITTLLGYQEKEYIGKRTHQFWHPDDARNLNVARSLKHSDTGLFECRVRHRNGHYIWFETRITAVRNEEGEMEKIIGVSRDITEKKRTQELLQHSEKLALAGQLAAGIVHEVRNPLTAIKGFLQLMQEDFGSKMHYYDIISSEFTRIEMILSELLLLAKPQAARLDCREIQHVMDHVKALLETEANMKSVQIDTYIEPGLPPILCDENQLKQVFINFLKNGIEAMLDGGIIQIHVRKTDENTLGIRFIDQGSGIPQDQLAKLGQPFYTTKPNGTGLGFMISQQIIQKHQGEISVQSIVGQGTTVEILLPLNKKGS